MRIAIVGTDGMPARYGGFETFVEQIAPRLAAAGHEVTVVGSALGRAAPPPALDGLRIVNLPLSANGAASILFDLWSLVRVRGSVDAVLVLGVSAGLFTPLMRALAGARRVVFNVDGLEARRAKWSGLKRVFLSLSERSAVMFADAIVSDNQGIAEMVSKQYGRVPTTIAYGHDHVVRLSEENAARMLRQRFDLGIGEYCLSIARIEPENHIAEMIAAFLNSRRRHYAVVGNFARTEYGRGLKARHAGEPRLRLIDAVYEQEPLAALRTGCAVYLHGHGVGGTNPSLVEMLPYGRPILAFDCSFNRHTLQGRCGYFADSSELTSHLDRADLTEFAPPPDLQRSPGYAWDNIARHYAALLDASAAEGR